LNETLWFTLTLINQNLRSQFLHSRLLLVCPQYPSFIYLAERQKRQSGAVSKYWLCEVICVRQRLVQHYSNTLCKHTMELSDIDSLDFQDSLLKLQSKSQKKTEVDVFSICWNNDLWCIIYEIRVNQM